jgi:hypothetical protein|tara:strand:+ start:334 stop:756 length:423 start_codon:yes stop_codon:yes gene_type:complete
MAKVIIYEGDDGLEVISPASHLKISEAAERLVPYAKKYRIIESSQLPPDLEFWGAWTIDCEVDIEKAKSIWLDKIRLIRDEKLKKLDLKWMIAMEQGEAKEASNIASKKQLLRDVTERREFRKVKTVEQIKEYWPEILEG